MPGARPAAWAVKVQTFFWVLFIFAGDNGDKPKNVAQVIVIIE